ncbi:MAG: diacylglycerol/lipid kinase family protein [Acholeplasmataceae bacterium]
MLINPASGREKVDKIVEVAKRKFNERDYHLDVYFSTCPNDLTEKAYLWAHDYDTYIVCGGDGTVNEVINGVMKSDIRPSIAIVPLGTVNDIAKIFGIPKKVDQNLDLIFDLEPVATDINQINDRYFVYVAAAGYLTAVSYDADREEKKKYGSLAYLKTGIRELRQKPFFKAKIECNNETYTKYVSLLLVLSANQFGGMKLFRFSKQTKLNDGLFDLRVFSYKRISLLFRLVLFILRAGKKQYHELQFSTNHAIITPLEDKEVNWNADGELVTKGKVEIKSFKQALKFYVHPKRIKKLY